ncbi:MAG: glycosyltransferase, partial [Bacteroidota bacterium]|nr:glycosyltransferase [Bacteroidota bacterium]
MNIFIIPSWYPDISNPVGGIFIKEQAEALADLNPQHNFIVSHCENFYLSITKPSVLVKTLMKYSDKKHLINNVKQNLFEYYTPAVSWTEKFGGEIKNILKAHIQNFTEAANNLGKIDLLHAHVSYPAGFSAMKIKEQFNVPFIITEHMGPFPFEQFIQNGTLSDKISKPIQNADEIITVSNYSAAKIKSFDLRKPVVIPNMINENVFYPPDNKLQTRKIKFLTATTFIERKGIRELMEGILRSDKAHLNTGFTIAGTGYMHEYIEQFIAQNSLADKVILVKGPS